MSFVRQLGELRDGLLVLGAGVYVTGYAVWAAYAYSNGFGPVPALDAQYFVVGFPVFCTLCLAIIVVIGVAYVLNRYWRSLHQLVPLRVRKRAPRVIIVVTLAMATLYWVLRHHLLPIAAAVGDVTLVIIYSTGALLTFMFMLADDDFLDPYGDALKPLMVTEVLLFLSGWVVLLVVTTYVFDIYPLVPSALGGPSPRIAQLDISRESLSVRTRGDIVGPTSSGDRILCSKRLFVYSETADFLWVATEQRRAGKTWTIHQLPRSSILTIHWLR